MRNAFLILFLTLNLITFLAFALDKWRARRGARRTPEAVLLWLTLLGGAPAAWLAMGTFRHKTQKTSFRWKFYLATLICAIWLGGLLWLWSRA